MRRFNLFSKCLKYYRDTLDRRRIKKYDQGDSSKRDFELVSTRNYETQCIELFEEVFKEKMTKEFWNWKYTPHGMKWRGVCALKDGKVIGHYNGIARHILYFGQHKKALLPCDIMVSEKSRGGIQNTSIYNTLVRVWTSMNIGLHKEFLLGYGFPHRRHYLVGMKMGLSAKVDTMVECIWDIKKISPLLPQTIMYIYELELNKESVINQVWQKMAYDFKEEIIGIRNFNYIKARYINHPRIKYDSYLVYDDNKILLGVFILKKINNDIYIMDIITQKIHFNIIILSIIQIGIKINAHNIKCWIDKSHAKLLNFYDVVEQKTDVIIPTSTITPNFDPKKIAGKCYFTYGDTDFL